MEDLETFISCLQEKISFKRQPRKVKSFDGTSNAQIWVQATTCEIRNALFWTFVDEAVGLM